MTPARDTRYKGDYTDLEKVDSPHDSWVYRHPTKRAVNFATFLVSPVVLYDNPAEPIAPNYRKTLDQKALELRQSIIQILSSSFTVVEEPGPQTLRLDLAISDIKPIRLFRNESGNSVTVVDTTRKGTKFELTATESKTEERVITIVTLFTGDSYLAFKDPELLTNVENEFDGWVRFLVERLKLAKERQTSGTALDERPK